MATMQTYTPKVIPNRASLENSLQRARNIVREVSKSTPYCTRTDATVICRDLEAMEGVIEQLAVILRTGKVPR